MLRFSRNAKLLIAGGGLGGGDGLGRKGDIGPGAVLRRAGFALGMINEGAVGQGTGAVIGRAGVRQRRCGDESGVPIMR